MPESLTFPIGDVFVTVAPDGDRPYVSSTPPSLVRIEIARVNRWRIFRIPLAMDLVTGELFAASVPVEEFRL